MENPCCSLYSELRPGFYIRNAEISAVTCHYFDAESACIPRQTAEMLINPIELGLICVKKRGEIWRYIYAIRV